MESPSDKGSLDYCWAMILTFTDINTKKRGLYPHAFRHEYGTLCTYLIRDISGEVWRQARKRVLDENLPMKEVIVRLIDKYAQGEVTI